MENKTNFNLEEVIFREGEEANTLYMIDQGAVICLKASKDRQIPVFVARKGDIIGENAMLPNSYYAYTTIAIEKTTAIRISADSLSGVLEKSPVWLAELAKVMILRFQQTASLIAENRVIHNSIIPEENFTPGKEVEYKKAISLNKTE